MPATIDTMEIWELTIPGMVAVTVTGEYGKERTISGQGVGQRIRLTTYDRRIAEERVRDRVNNPFRNGMLVQINRDVIQAEEAALAAAQSIDYVPEPPSDDELTDDELSGTFGLSVEDGSFAAAVGSFSEVNVRRLARLAITQDAKGSQIAYLNDFIRDSYPIGGTTPTYEEMQATPASAVR